MDLRSTTKVVHNNHCHHTQTSVALFTFTFLYSLSEENRALLVVRQSEIRTFLGTVALDFEDWGQQSPHWKSVLYESVVSPLAL